jgi:hypothetical protein
MVVKVTLTEGTESQGGFTDRDEGRPAAESVGERLLGALLDRVHLIPPRLVGQLIAQEARIAGPPTSASTCRTSHSRRGGR